MIFIGLEKEHISISFYEKGKFDFIKIKLQRRISETFFHKLIITYLVQNFLDKKIVS